MLDVFVTQPRRDALEQRLEAATGLERLPLQVELAWYLRQLDWARSLALADEAEQGLAAWTGPESRRLAARLTLLRAETRLLFADLGEAQRLAAQAIAEFEAIDDQLGLGDAHSAMSTILFDGPDTEGRNRHIDLGLAAYQRAGHADRAALVSARRVANSVLSDPAAAARALEQGFCDEPVPDVVRVWELTIRALVAALSNEPVASIRFFTQAHELCLELGALRNAIVSGSNAAESFTRLGDLEAALEWQERVLALARSTGWPGSVSMCLSQLGNVMRKMQRNGEARAYLQEAMSLGALLPGSSHQGNICVALGQLEMEDGNFEAGLAAFGVVQAMLANDPQHELHEFIWCAQAQVLLQQGQVQQALEKAGAALSLKLRMGDKTGQIRVLQLLARMQAPAGLRHLQQALDVAQSISGYQTPAELHQQLATAHADAGDFAAAYEHSQFALTTFKKTQNSALNNRALAMQARFELDQARAEARREHEVAEALRETTAAAELARQQAHQALLELRQTQKQLVQAEKMASLGGLVAGVAHELNTPLGNGLVAVTALSDKLAAFQQGMAGGGLKRQAFDAFLQDVELAAQLAQASLQRSAKLVSSFKQLAIDQGAWPRGECAPVQTFDTALQNLRPALAARGIAVEIDAPAELRFASYPSALSAVLGRLLDNALEHGFAGRDQGRVSLRCERLDGGGCRLTVRDNGCGIAAEHLAKVFDPFFTTRMGQSSGLGLYSANNLVTQVLGGTLTVSSVPGEGSEFVLELPPA
ncbi:MAG: hypothetical protein IV092_10410 [Burkholderiaceae bacterium]|nr:hypothetical protein [Burkholderiaceae bacterium]